MPVGWFTWWVGQKPTASTACQQVFWVAILSTIIILNMGTHLPGKRLLKRCVVLKWNFSSICFSSFYHKFYIKEEKGENSYNPYPLIANENCKKVGYKQCACNMFHLTWLSCGPINFSFPLFLGMPMNDMELSLKQKWTTIATRCNTPKNTVSDVLD